MDGARRVGVPDAGIVAADKSAGLDAAGDVSGRERLLDAQAAEILPGKTAGMGPVDRARRGRLHYFSGIGSGNASDERKLAASVTAMEEELLLSEPWTLLYPTSPPPLRNRR